MRFPRIRRYPVLLLLALAGCSSTIGSKFGGNSQSRSIVVNGDRPLPATVGEPGGQVAADTAEPEPRRNPKARISGRVLDEAGKPVPGATVRLADGNSKGGRDVQATTDRSGAFTLGGLRPGSSYWLIAEVDDDQGSRTGRVRAKTAETGVEISLGDQGNGTDPADDRTSRRSRVRPISDKEEVDREPSKVNDEDLAPPADQAELPPAGKSKASGRPRLSAPEPAVGWKKPGEDIPARRQARSDPDLDSIDDARSDPASKRSTDPSADDGPNPLPPAIQVGRSGRVDDDTPPPARTKPRRRTPPADSDVDSGGLTLPPDSGTDDEPPTPRARSTRKPRADPGPPPMPSLDSTEATGEGPSAAFASVPPSKLEPDPALMGSSAPPGLDPGQVRQAVVIPSSGGEAIVLHDPPRGEGPTAQAPALPNPINAMNPAPEPVSSSPGAAAVASATAPATAPASNEYNPFALIAEAAPAGPAVVMTGLSASPRTSAPASAPEPPPVDDVAASPPAAKTKWGDVAPSPVNRARPAGDAARPTSLFARFRNSASAKDPASAPMCDYDPKARKLNDFRLPDLEGKPVRFKDLDADYVLLDFWGTWCNPCLDSIPHLIELQKEYGPGKLKVVGIACEKVGGEQRRAKVEAFTRKLGMNYTVLLSTMDGSCPVQKGMQVHFNPTMILLDRTGQVLWSAVGATPANLEMLDRALTSMSREDSASR